MIVSSSKSTGGFVAFPLARADNPVPFFPNHSESLLESAPNVDQERVFRAGREGHFRVASAVLGMSGVDCDKDVQLVTGWGREVLLEQSRAHEATTLNVYNDSMVALVSGTLPRSRALITPRDIETYLSGIVVICGTGTVCFGRNGRTQARASGWGHLIDQGSGYAIGLDVVRAVMHGEDTSGPAVPAFKRELLRRLKLQQVARAWKTARACRE